jgi:hypothetical protein
MAIADRAGLVGARRDDAALICLTNTTRRDKVDGPQITIGANGNPMVIP